MNTDIAKAFRVIRAAYGLQQAELAPRIGISASQLSLIEKGKRQPSLRVITNISDALGVPPPLIMLLASDPDEIADSDITELASVLLRLLVSASEEKQQALRLET
jgi:transcriptional regulator with XRE-family HTH domain